jgi:hypothetical protein
VPIIRETDVRAIAEANTAFPIENLFDLII